MALMIDAVREEMIDVTNSSGELQGRSTSKSEIHRQGLWHRAAHVWILGRGRVLLQRRSPRKENHPGLWDVSAAGHVSSGEDVLLSAVRELGEEIGIHLDASALVPIGEITEEYILHDGLYIDREVVTIFAARLDLDPATLTLQEEEVAEVRWWTASELEQRARDRDPGFVPHGDEYLRIAAMCTV